MPPEVVKGEVGGEGVEEEVVEELEEVVQEVVEEDGGREREREVMGASIDKCRAEREGRGGERERGREGRANWGCEGGGNIWGDKDKKQT